MPLLEYYCPTCEDSFEVLRPMRSVEQETDCPVGHSEARKLLSVFAAIGATSEVGLTGPAATQGSNACCGMGGCCN